MFKAAITVMGLLSCVAQLGAVDGADEKWRVTPLALMGAEAEGGGTFQQFGDIYATPRFVLFWARVGPTAKDWALFSSKDGKLVRVAQAGVPIPTPDKRTIWLYQNPSIQDSPVRVMHAGKNLVYISSGTPAHIYAWDGERLVAVLVAGDVLTVNGVPYQIKKAVVLDVDEAGRALIYYDANKPEAEGWAIYDGAKFIPLWMEGGALPGNPGVTIKNLSSGAFCITSCVPDARLLGDGSLLATVEVSGAPHKKGLYHFTAERAQLLLVDSPAVRLGKILAARADAFVMDASDKVGTVESTGTTISLVRTTSPKLLFYNAGRTQLFPLLAGSFELLQVSTNLKFEYGLQTVVPGGLTFDYDGAMFVDTTSPRALVSVRASSVSKKGILVFRQSTTSYPGVYFFDGEKLERIDWEAGLGLAPEAVRTKLRSFPGQEGLSSASVERILLGRLEQPAGVRVQLPLLDSARSARLVAAGSSDGKLALGTAFETDGEAVTAADVLVRNSADEVTASTSRGIFSLRRLRCPSPSPRRPFPRL